MKMSKKIYNSWDGSVNRLAFYSLLYTMKLNIFDHSVHKMLMHHRINWDYACVYMCDYFLFLNNYRIRGICKEIY